MANYIYTQVLNSTFDLVFVVNGAQQNIAKAALGTAGCEVYISDSAGVINPSSTYVTVRNNSGELYIGHVPDITQPTGLTDAQSLVNYINTLLQEVVINGGGGGQPGAGVITFNTRNGNVVLTTADINAAMGVSTSDFQNAVGTTAQQPTAAVGMQRYNSDTGLFEFYNGAWINFATTSSLGNYLPIAGGTLTGKLGITANPTAASTTTAKGQFLDITAGTYTYGDAGVTAIVAGTAHGIPTFTASSTGSVTTGANVYIAGDSVGANTNYGLWNNGKSRFTGSVLIIDSTVAATLGTGALSINGGITIGSNLFIGGGYTGTQSLTIGSFLNVAASTFTDSNNTTAASWAGSYLGQPTLSTSGTITTGSTLYIPSAPAVTGGGAINSVYALRVGANALFEGGIIQSRAVATSSGNANNINTTMTITVANSANTYMNTFSLQTASSGNLTNNTTGGLSAVIGDINAGGTGTVSLAASHVAQLRITAAQAVTEYDGYRVLAPTNAGGGTLAEFNGYKVEDHSIGTVIYGFRGKLSSGTGKFNIYADGTATNYLAGNTGIGVTASASAFVNYGAGTTTVAANLYQNGVLNTTPLAGTHEYANNHYLTNYGSVRYAVGGMVFQTTTSTALSGNTVQTVLWTQTIDYRYFSQNNDIITGECDFTLTSGAAVTKELYLDFGTTPTNVFTSSALTTVIAAKMRWTIFRLSSTTYQVIVDLVAGNFTGGLAVIAQPNVQTTVVTATAATNLTLRVQGKSTNAAFANNDIVSNCAFAEYKPAV